MRPKLKHIRHPFQTAKTLKNLVSGYLSEKVLGYRGMFRFGRSAEYSLQNVTDGFISCIDDQSDDKELLNRICTAYIKAIEQQNVSEIYAPTAWWDTVKRTSLHSVIQALSTRNIDALQKMYRNFFRDPCSAGLIGLPGGLSKAYFNGSIKNIHRRSYLADALYRIDYWKKQTGFTALDDLAGPDIGNPFGVRINGTLIRAGAEYQHYCAHRLIQLLKPGSLTIAEIGGGYGGMAYYLLRDAQESVTYIDFDVPESIALTSYYLLKAFPERKFLLYGEQELTQESITEADVVLMPLYELSKLPAGSVDLLFSSHAISDLSDTALAAYWTHIARTTRNYFVYIGNSHAENSSSDVASHTPKSFQLIESRSSRWNSHRNLGDEEIECVYHRGPS